MTFELITGTTEDVDVRLARYTPLLKRLERTIDWQMGIPFNRDSIN